MHDLEMNVIRSFNGKTPRIAASAFISEAAYVVGDVEIGEDSSVWPGAVIRADSGRIKIGRNTAIEDNCVIHTGTPPHGDVSIGDMVHMGHGAVYNGRTIGNNVLIGMNATVLHGTEIGDFCIIAAGSLVTQGMKVPDRSFVVGAPAVIRGETSQEQLWWVTKAPENYLKLVRQYKKEGF